MFKLNKVGNLDGSPNTLSIVVGLVIGTIVLIAVVRGVKLCISLYSTCGYCRKGNVKEPSIGFHKDPESLVQTHNNWKQVVGVLPRYSSPLALS